MIIISAYLSTSPAAPQIPASFPNVASAAYILPAGTQPGDIFKLKGRGIPVLNSTRRGDQLIRVNIEVPKNLNDKQKEALMNFNTTMGAKAVEPEEKKGFFGEKKKK